MQVIRRIALGVRYDGTAYHGWQAQDDTLPTVQLFLEQALSRVANQQITVTCAGRTDAGVHACAQVVHFDTDVERSDYSWVFGANSNLPPDIAVQWAMEVPRDFHARFSAASRRYRYIIYNHNVRPAILRSGVAWYHKPLDERDMLLAGNYLLGEHDFTSFRGSDCQSKSPIRELREITVRRHHRMVVIEVMANAFLLHMVRNIAGVLIPIGAGDKPPEWAKTVLEARNRSAAGVTVTASGLYMVDVQYPEAFHLPKTPIGPFFLP